MRRIQRQPAYAGCLCVYGVGMRQVVPLVPDQKPGLLSGAQSLYA